MEQQSEKMKLAMIYGIYIAVVTIIISVVIWATSLLETSGLMTSMLIALFNLVILTFLLVYFTKRYRDDLLQGSIRFGQAFTFGVMLVVFSSVIGALFSYILNKYIDPQYMHRVMTHLQDATYNMLAKSGMSEDQIEQQMVKFEEKGIPSPMATLVSTLESGLIGGAIISLISSAIVKKNQNKEDAFDEAMEDVKTEE
jgi:magnesium-transporting ATPase (P-type)